MLLSHWALLGFATWTLCLVFFTIGLPRLTAIARGQARPNSFDPSVPHGSDRYRRSMRAHANCIENLPIFAALVLLGSSLGVSDPLFQHAAFAVLPARILQSIAHIASAQNRAVLIRFIAFCAQLACFTVLIALLVAQGLR